MKRHFHNKFTVTVTIFVVAAMVAIISLYISQKAPVEASTAAVNTELPQKTPGTPLFSFDASKVSAWRQGPTDKVSMAAFHDTNDCFVSVQYKPGEVDAATEIQKKQDVLRSSGYASTPGSVLALGLEAGAGMQQYQLRQFSVTSAPGSNKVKGGQEFGYVQLTDGYVKVEGWCDEPAQLPSTISVLQAISFKEEK